MSEQNTESEILTGRESVESSQGFQKMPMAHPSPAPDLKDFPVEETETFGPKEAAAEVIRKRRDGVEGAPEGSAEGEPVNRSYINYGGSKAGQPRPPNETVPISRAAADLEGLRSVEETIRLQQLESELIASLDADAKAAAEIQAAEPRIQPNPVEEIPPPLEGQVGAQADKLTKLFQENPELLETVEAYRTQTEQAVAQTQQQAVQYTQAVAQQYVNELAATSAQALQLFAAKYPALAGLQTTDQIRGAIAAMDHQAPEQAAQLRADINTITQVASKAQEAQQQQMQAAQNQHRAQFDYVAQHADNAFDSWAQTQDTPEQVRAISDHARQLLRSEGLSDAQVNHLWQNDGLFRSVTGQKILYLASKASLSMAGARSKAVRPVPTVQRPAGGHRGSEADYNLGKLSAQLDRDQSPRSAAALLTARRNAARR